jgi:hypothetical protein
VWLRVAKIIIPPFRLKSVFQNLTVCQAITLTNRCQTVRHENHRVQLLYNGYRRSWLL